jgi:hypothetical protein
MQVQTVLGGSIVIWRDAKQTVNIKGSCFLAEFDGMAGVVAALTASTTQRIVSRCSESGMVEASPVVPATTMASVRFLI